MIITLSEERNEKLVLEWSGEITDKHAQDFCDVCNAVFLYHFDLDYMHRKYDENVCGKSFIMVVYKNDKPIAAWGGWRNDINGRTAFQMCDFVTLPEARKGGYIVDMNYCVHDEIGKLYPQAITYGFPGSMAWRVSIAFGNAVVPLYVRIYHGITKDFTENMPFIDDTYVENWLVKNKNARIIKLGGRYYFVRHGVMKGFIPYRIILGEISSKYKDSFRRAGRLRPLLYYSRKPGILGGLKAAHVAKYDMAANIQDSENMPLLYTADTNTLHFNGLNKH